MVDRRWMEEKRSLQRQKEEVRPSASYNKLLSRVAFRILSPIHDGALLGKDITVLRR